jgi:hypothetical protein
VLVAGGYGAYPLRSAELYDPDNGTWTDTGSLAQAHFSHTATLLPNGKVLVAGGADAFGSFLVTAELYDPTSGTWTVTGSLHSQRAAHTATLLPDGEVLVAGGVGDNYVERASAELYDPASGIWTETASLATARDGYTATLLPNGKVLAAGGTNLSGSLASVELYDVGLGFSSLWQPEIATATLRFTSGHHLRLTGSRFQGISQASGDNYQDSSSNYPIVQLRSVDSSEVVFLLVDPVGGWSDTSFTSRPVRGFPHGPALVTVFTNGIPSTAKYLVVPQRHQ